MLASYIQTDIYYLKYVGESKTGRTQAIKALPGLRFETPAT